MGDDLRRERMRHCIGEFERRIRERVLSIDGTECQDLLRNCPPGLLRRNGNESKERPFEYITVGGETLLKINDPGRANRACPECELFGRNHCCGGLVFLAWALYEAGVERPAELLADRVPGPSDLYRPNLEKMEEKLELLRTAMERFFEDRLEHISDK